MSTRMGDTTLERQRRRWSTARGIGLLAGPALGLIAFLVLPVEYTTAQGPQELTYAARATLAVMAWMATWWLTEAVDVSVTALLPIVLFPLVGVGTVGEATAPYASSVIFLFLGGFVIALSMQRWGLDRRIALRALRLVGTRPANLIGGFMLATALLSAFVSNTATTALMLPIGVSVIALAERSRESAESDDPGLANLPVALMLAIAYAASIGGLSTILGTPPNLFLVGYLADSGGLEVTFLRWLRVGVPLTAVLLPLAWWLLTRRLYPVGDRPIPDADRMVRDSLAELGRIGRGERITLWVFALTALAWISRPLLTRIELAGARPLAGLSDTGIAMLAALALFVIPVDLGERKFTMDWRTAERLPWGVLILFGGGLSLAAAVQRHGVAEFLGAQAHGLAAWPELLVIALVALGTIFLTELTSNTATAATLVPILAAVAPGLGIDPMRLVLPATLAASCAFMLPVATPPNAIVFASGRLDLRQMARAGLWLNLLSVPPIVALAYLGLSTGP